MYTSLTLWGDSLSWDACKFDRTVHKMDWTERVSDDWARPRVKSSGHVCRTSSTWLSTLQNWRRLIFLIWIRPICAYLSIWNAGMLRAQCTERKRRREALSQMKWLLKYGGIWFGTCRLNATCCSVMIGPSISASSSVPLSDPFVAGRYKFWKIICFNKCKGGICWKKNVSY